MKTANQIRSSFIDFFKDKGHKFVPSAPVVPIGDETLLFTNAGMNQFKDIFLGLSKPESLRAANSQKCIRAGGKHNDLEEVGVDTYHHTFFEMLGNWSFGDYFKAEAIEWAWELIVDVWGMDPTRLHASYFEGDKEQGLEPDTEARDLWRKFLPDERIHPGNKKDNFWEMGDTGPCGPCSEIHYDDTPDKSGGQFVNKDNPDVIEIWNLVFIQYNRDGDGKLSPLPDQHVDTGMGLERVARFMQGKKSNYDTDLFMTIINAICKLTGHKYTSKLDSKTDSALRVIADHIRSLTFAITDGATPSNEGRGYVVRRILRRAARFGRVLGMHKPFMYKLIDVLAAEMGDAFPEIRDRAEFVTTVIEAEEASFGRTLDRGLEIFASAAKRAGKTDDKTIMGEDAFQLYDTYGFPLDLTQLMARESDLKVDSDTFQQLMEEQRERARAAQKSSMPKFVIGNTELPRTDDSLKYKTDTCVTKVVGWLDFECFNTKDSVGVDHKIGPDRKYTDKDEMLGIVLQTTCFYAESGGQVGDIGIIESDNAKFDVKRTEMLGDCVVHWGKLDSGRISIGDEVKATVDKDRDACRKNHTATHLLQWALQEVLGYSVKQQGSLVSPEYLRFDFTYPKAVTNEQVKLAEKLVRGKIAEDKPVICEVMAIDEAKKLGAMALFNEKYGNEVRVVAIGTDNSGQIHQAFSKEFCGGTHLDRTGRIGGFKIVKEESISAGVRRITALTGAALNDYLIERSDVVDEVSQILKTPVEQLADRARKLIEDNKKLSKQLKSASRKGGSDTIAEAAKLLEKAEVIEGVSVIVGQIGAVPIQQIREAIDSLKKKAKSAAIVLGIAEGDDKAMLLAAMTDDVAKKGIKAGDIIKEVAPIVDGRGGGRPQMAQAGGKNPAKIKEALSKAGDLIKEKLA